MKFLVIGAGGVGGYFGSRLAAVHDVLFVARGEHLAAMRASGLRVDSAGGSVVVEVQATDDPEPSFAPDAILLCVKLWQLDEALETAHRCLAPQTVVVPLQNGVSAVESAIARLGRERVIGGTCHIAAEIASPGVIRHTGSIARLTIGELDGRRSARLAALADALAQARVDVVVSDDVQRAIWEKFVMLSAFSGLTASHRSAIGPLRADPRTRETLQRAIAESAGVARRLGVAIAADCEEATMAFIDKLPAEMKSSMLVDLERGRRLEWPWLSGHVVALGQRLGLPTPAHEGFVAVLRAQEAAA